MPDLKPAEGVVSAPEVEPVRPGAQHPGAGEVVLIEAIRLILDQVGVGGEAAGGGQQESPVLWRDIQKCLLGLEAKGDGLTDQVRILVGDVDTAAPGQGISKDVHGNQFGGTGGEGEGHEPQNGTSDDWPLRRSPVRHTHAAFAVVVEEVGGVYTWCYR